MTPRYFEAVSIENKPESDGWYDLIDPKGDYRAESYYFKKDQWFESEERAEIGIIDEDDDVEGFFWLLTISSLPIDRDTAEKIWEAGNQSAYHSVKPEGPCDFDVEGNRRNKETYLKQFE